MDVAGSCAGGECSDDAAAGVVGGEAESVAPEFVRCVSPVRTLVEDAGASDDVCCSESSGDGRYVVVSSDVYIYWSVSGSIVADSPLDG